MLQYVNQGVGELDQDKLASLVELKYHSIANAADELGGVPVIRDAFVGFQQFLYEEPDALPPGRASFSQSPLQTGEG